MKRLFGLVFMTISIGIFSQEVLDSHAFYIISNSDFIINSNSTIKNESDFYQKNIKMDLNGDGLTYKEYAIGTNVNNKTNVPESLDIISNFKTIAWGPHQYFPDTFFMGLLDNDIEITLDTNKCVIPKGSSICFAKQNNIRVIWRSKDNILIKLKINGIELENRNGNIQMHDNGRIKNVSFVNTFEYPKINKIVTFYYWIEFWENGGIRNGLIKDSFEYKWGSKSIQIPSDSVVFFNPNKNDSIYSIWLDKAAEIKIDDKTVLITNIAIIDNNPDIIQVRDKDNNSFIINKEYKVTK